MAEAWAALIQRVEDSQLMHMCSRNPVVIWEDLACIHCSRGLAMCLALRRKFLMSVKGERESMVAWIGQVKGLVYKLEVVSLEDMILALTMGLNNLYDSFIIFLDSTPINKLTLKHVMD